MESKLIIPVVLIIGIVAVLVLANPFPVSPPQVQPLALTPGVISCLVDYQNGQSVFHDFDFSSVSNQIIQFKAPISEKIVECDDGSNGFIPNLAVAEKYIRGNLGLNGSEALVEYSLVENSSYTIRIAIPKATTDNKALYDELSTQFCVFFNKENPYYAANAAIMNGCSAGSFEEWNQDHVWLSYTMTKGEGGYIVSKGVEINRPLRPA
jgi:hypothetical protein